jgi:mono/diheme cytochrome c family protein
MRPIQLESFDRPARPARLGAAALPLAGALLGLLLGLPRTGTLLAGEPPAPTAGSTASPGDEQIQRGERLYHIHCLNCHGEGGHGDGPMAQVLSTEIPDLTVLARGHGGTFPRERVTGFIDGRFRVPGHGAQEMPVWGLSFQERGRDSAREPDIQQRLRDLTAYLESIQIGTAAP